MPDKPAQSALSAAPTPTRFDSILSDSSIFLVAFRGVFSLTLSGCPALCVKAFAPHPSHTTLIRYSFSACPL